jgi:HEAT repeat protein
MNLLDMLAGGDRRSIGRVDEVVQMVLNEPGLFDLLFSGMQHDDPVIRMRAADAVEKITARHFEYLQPYKEQLLGSIAAVDQQEVRWHVAQMLPRLALNPAELGAAVQILRGYLDDRSQIVKTSAIQALADLAETDAGLRQELIPLLEQLVQTGSPAVKSRGRRLLAKLKRG